METEISTANASTSETMEMVEDARSSPTLKGLKIGGITRRNTTLRGEFRVVIVAETVDKATKELITVEKQYTLQRGSIKKIRQLRKTNTPYIIAKMGRNTFYYAEIDADLKTRRLKFMGDYLCSSTNQMCKYFSSRCKTGRCELHSSQYCNIEDLSYIIMGYETINMVHDCDACVVTDCTHYSPVSAKRVEKDINAMRKEDIEKDKKRRELLAKYQSKEILRKSSSSLRFGK